MANNEMHLSSQRSKYTASINALFRGCIITDRYRRMPQSSIPFDPASPKWVRNTSNSEGFVRLESSAENGRKRYSEGGVLNISISLAPFLYFFYHRGRKLSRKSTNELVCRRDHINNYRTNAFSLVPHICMRCSALFLSPRHATTTEAGWKGGKVGPQFICTT